MYLRNHFQNGFVTRDLNRALELIDGRLGPTDWLRFEPDLVMKTPLGPRDFKTKVALAWMGDLQIELIEPVSGFVDAFLPALPADASDPTPRFHHIAVRRDDEAVMRREIQELRFPVVFEGQYGDVTFIYVDAREALGHYLEFGCSTSESWEQRWPKDKPVVG